MSQYIYQLQDTLSGDVVAEEWQNLVAQQARALDTMLHSLRTNLITLRRRTELPEQHKVRQFETLIRTTVTGLAALAQQLVKVEQHLDRLTHQTTQPQGLPPEHLRLVHTLEQVVSVLHANLTIARQALLAMVQESADGPQPS